MNILIVKLSALGDVIHALPVSAALKHRYPEAHLTWVVEPPAYDIVKHNPLVDEIIVFEKKKFKSWSGLCREYPPFKKLLARRKYDLSIDLQGLFKSAAVIWAAGAKKKVGYCDMREGANLLSKAVIGPHAQGHIVDRYLDTLMNLPGDNGPIYFPWQFNAAEKARVKEMMATEGLNPDTKYVALAVGTNWGNKCWSPESFARLADLLHEEGLEVVLLGFGAKDEARAEAIMEQAKEVPVNFVSRTSLGETAVLIKGARAVVGGDTGNLHLAAALETPVMMLMGPTNPERNGPYKQLDHVITAGRSCDGCWQRKCPKQLDCLSTITPEAVLEKLKAVWKAQDN